MNAGPEATRPDVETRSVLDAAEQAAVKEGDFAARQDCEDQVGRLKALDFIDAWGPDMGVLSVCRARARHCARRGAISFGSSLPGKLRWQGC